MFYKGCLDKDENILLFRFSGDVKESDFDEFIACIDELCDKGEPFCTIFDIRNIKNISKKEVLNKTRYMIAKEELQEYVKSFVVLTNSYIFRKTLSFVFYLNNYSDRSLVTYDMDKAMEFIYCSEL